MEKYTQDKSDDASYYVDFEEVLERLNNLEIVVQKLLTPEIMYRRPGNDDHETLTETLDYLHKKIKELESRNGH